ncbi:MAG: zinc ribbon domain-containing protein [bacterium]
MDKNLQQLIQLQKLDSQIQAKHTRLNELPLELNRHRDTLNAIIAKHDAAHHEFERLTKERHACELDLKQDEENVKTFSSQLYSVKTNEQYNALKHEIAQIKEKISKTEDAILELMDKLDTTKKTWDEQKKKVEEGKRVFAEEEKKILDEETSVKSTVAELELSRKEITQTIDTPILASYQKISQRWKGQALASIKGEICQGCSMKLPPQVIAEVNKNDKIVRCENCARILFAEEIGQ